MTVKDFKAWDLSQTNKAPQATYNASSDLADGVAANEVADSPIFNKMAGQATFVAAMVMSWISDVTGLDTLDDGNLSAAQTKFVSALLAQAGVEATVSSNTAVAAADNRKAFVNTAALTYTIAQTTTLGSSWRSSIQALGGNATIAINGADKINGGTAGVGMVIPQGMTALVVTDGAGNFYVAIVGSTGAITTVTGATTLTPAQANGLVLVDTSSGNYNLTYPAGANLKALRSQVVKITSDANTCTLVPSGSDTFAGTTGNLSLVLQWSNISLLCDGATTAKWYQTDAVQKRGTIMTLETGLANAMLAGATNAYLGANVKHDGTNFNRQNAAIAAAALILANDGTLQRLKKASGSNPISSWDTLDAVITAAGGTMTGLLALFTGSTVPTATKGDNTTKIASTAFLKAAGMQFQAGLALTGNNSLTAAQVGNLIELSGGATPTQTLPALSALNDGEGYVLLNRNSNNQTINSVGGDVIHYGLNSTGLTFQLRQGDFVLLYKAGSVWVAVGTESFARLTDLSTYVQTTDFVGTYSAQGQLLLPGGLILKWGDTGSVNGGLQTYNLPSAFPNNFFQIVGACQDGNTTGSFTLDPVGLGQYKASHNGSSANKVHYLAIGN